MPSTFAAIDKHTVAALHKGDASALERILRAEYAALLHVAEKQVGDPGIAAGIGTIRIHERRLYRRQ